MLCHRANVYNQVLGLKRIPLCSVYILWSGPDGLADNRPHLLVDRRPISTNPYTSEATWDTEYLWRYTPTPTPRDQPVYLRPRSAFAGEIGWHSLQQYWDTEPRRTGHQILVSQNVFVLSIAFKKKLFECHYFLYFMLMIMFGLWLAVMQG